MCQTAIMFLSFASRVLLLLWFTGDSLFSGSPRCSVPTTFYEASCRRTSIAHINHTGITCVALWL